MDAKHDSGITPRRVLYEDECMRLVGTRWEDAFVECKPPTRYYVVNAEGVEVEVTREEFWNACDKEQNDGKG